MIIHLPKWFCPQSSACVEEVRGGIVPDRVDGGVDGGVDGRVDGRVDGGGRHEEPYLDEPADLRAGQRVVTSAGKQPFFSCSSSGWPTL